MALTLVTGPEQEPITLQKAKAQLRLDVDTEDDLLRGYIKTAREWIEGQTRRGLITQTWDLHIDDDWPWQKGQPYISLPLNPLASVTSITYDDGSSPRPTLAADQYTASARAHGSFIVPAYGVTWPSVRCVPSAIIVRFIVGTAATGVPNALQTAIAMLVAHLYENREASAAKALTAVPFGVESLVSPFRAGSLAR